MAKMNDEAWMEARHNARMKREGKQEAILLRRLDAAEQMIGELCREGKTVLYVHPAGGRYREGTRADLIAFLMRNGYA